MPVIFRVKFAILALLLPIPYSLLPASAQDTRTVTEPVFPATCTTLSAQLSIVSGQPSSNTAFDTTRIQNALNACTSGKAVELAASGTNYAFLIAPINIPSGVTLLIDPGVTVFASTIPSNLGGSNCGTVTATQPTSNGCNNLITVGNSNPSSGAGIMGYGVIDARGSSPLLNSSGTPLTNLYPTFCTTFSFNCLTLYAYSTNPLSVQNVYVILSAVQASNFTLYKTTFKNATGFNIRWQGQDGVSTVTNGFTAWGVKILSGYNILNTDGIDPDDNSTNISIINTSISNGDDDISIKSEQFGYPITNISVSNLHTYAGLGFSLGSAVIGGVSNIAVNNMNMYGNPLYDKGTNTIENNGIQFKSAADRGNIVNNVQISNVCMQNLINPIRFFTNYVSNPNPNTFIPQYTNIGLHNVTVLADTNGDGSSGRFEFQGYDANHLNTITLDNLNVLGTPNTTYHGSFYTTLTSGPGPVTPASLQTIDSGNAGMTFVNKITNPTEAAYSCPASNFPLILGELFASTVTATNLQTVPTIPYSSTSTFALNAVVEPAELELPALTQPIYFYDSLNGAAAIGNVALGLNGNNGTLAQFTVTAPAIGNHTYTAQYPADTSYVAQSFGSVSLTVVAPVTIAATTPAAINPGANATSTFTFTPNAGYTGSLTLACSSPVTYITCTISTPPPAITGTTAVTAVATVTVAATYASLAPPTKNFAYAALLPLAALLLLPLFRNRRSSLRSLTLILLFASISASLIGCGGSTTTSGTGGTSSPPPPGSQTLTFTTTATGGYSTTTPVIVTVN